MSLFGNVANLLHLGGQDDDTGGALGNLGGLLGGHGDTVVDTGSVLGEPDAAPQDATLDLDLVSAPAAEPQDSVVNIGLFSAHGGNPLADADVLSGSYGAGGFLTAVDVGPDGVGPILGVHLMGDTPNYVELLGTPITDALGGGNILGDLHL